MENEIIYKVIVYLINEDYVSFTCKNIKEARSKVKKLLKRNKLIEDKENRIYGIMKNQIVYIEVKEEALIKF